MKAFWNDHRRRSTRTVKVSQRTQTPQTTLDDSVTPTEEPLGHVHGVYRHWVWLGLHRHSDF